MSAGLGRSPQLGGRLCYKVKRIGVVRDQDVVAVSASKQPLFFYLFRWYGQWELHYWCTNKHLSLSACVGSRAVLIVHRTNKLHVQGADDSYNAHRKQIV